MILISSLKLERKIAEDALSSWEKTKYIILTSAIYVFTGPAYVLTPSFGPKPPYWDAPFSVLTSTLSVLITYFGIKICHRTNKNFDDENFIERYTILNVPLTIKFMVFLLPAFILSFIVAVSLSDDKEIRREIMSYSIRVAVPIGVFVYYIFLNRSFHRLGKLIEEKKGS